MKETGEGWVELGEERVDPGSKVGGVVVDGVVHEVGEVRGVVDDYVLEPLEALGDLTELRGPDPVPGSGEEVVDPIRWLAGA